jgi:tetratricopeptide (TPR) repeat protein
MDDDRATKLEEARALLDMRRDLYGEADPATAEAVVHLSDLLRDAGANREARDLLVHSLSMQNRSSEKDDAAVTRTEFSLAIVLGRLGEHDSARRLWEGVLEASDRREGPESDQSIRAAINLAVTLRRLHRYGDEFPLRVRILSATRNALGPEHVDTHLSMVGLAQAHRSLGNHEMALSLFEEALAGLERSGVDQRTILYQKWAIAAELLALQRTREASEMFDQVVKGAAEHLAPDDPFRRRAMKQKRMYSLVGRFSVRRQEAGLRLKRRGKGMPAE